MKSAEAGNSWASLLFPAPVISVEGVGGGGPGTQQWTFGVHILYFGPSVTHLQICVKKIQVCVCKVSQGQKTIWFTEARACKQFGTVPDMPHPGERMLLVLLSSAELGFGQLAPLFGGLSGYNLSIANKNNVLSARSGG